MAEQIISPGVFYNENVPTVLEAAAAPIGAAIIGPTVLGPVGIPTVVTTYSDYLTKFGGAIVSGGIPYSFLTNISAQNYFKQGGTNLLVTRVAASAFTSATSSFISASAVSGSATGSSVFTLKTISQGIVMNSTSTENSAGALESGSQYNVRWEITNVDTASGVFTLLIRQGDDRTADKTILETWSRVSLDPTRDDYIAKVIGNQEFSTGVDGTDAYVTVTGEYPNKSKYIIVSNVGQPTPYYLNGAGTVNSKYTGSVSIPRAASGTFGSATGDLLANNPLFYDKISETNIQGLSASAYTASINLLKNKDQYAFNVISVPGLIYEFSAHKTVLDTLITNTTTRGDSILPIDLVNYNSATADVVIQANSLNTSYAAAYWPWLLVKNEDTKANVWCPASTIIPSVYVYNDNTSEAWFAPAGFTRGTMPNVIAPEKTLPRGLRDTLYNAKVNPIATFPGTGVVVYGQKTLQTVASALDRVNVRRLLITLKSYIGTVSQNLVFEPNSLQTRNSFLSVINPYLETVQQNQGLYAFKVVMDASNNGPDVIDRNELRGAIYLQPVKTAEFIVLDFNILPTGAEFPS